jgi:large subunit ribosomal protein L6
MIEGVTNGYKKALSIEGTALKRCFKGTKLSLSLALLVPERVCDSEGIKVTVDPNGLVVNVEGSRRNSSASCCPHPHYYPAEPYKGKGIKYVGEQIRRKQGKTVA